MDEKCQKILEDASWIQREYVKARLLGARSTHAATKVIHVSSGTPYMWKNLADLEYVVTQGQINQIESARWILGGLALPALDALEKALYDRAYRVAAANSLLDRMGLAKQTRLDVTSAGQQVPSPSIKEVIVNLSADIADAKENESLDEPLDDQ